MIIDRSPSYIASLAGKSVEDLRREHFAFRARAAKAETKDALVYAVDASGLVAAIGAFLFGPEWKEAPR